ncbi:uncharacterized protein NPIL_281311 [Nephila pilipes]|uniref:SMB domain-containing protein n=1 Tax=Nephila pilipes TaxID=299642 RepID=A0A8X6Q8L0_NEPPI|nr:uncharacterized protein NPIL_281311 [Nephila pilipes]
MISKIATFISVSEYNDGRKRSKADLMLALGMKINRKNRNNCVSVDKVRVSTNKKRATEASLEAGKAKTIRLHQERECYKFTENSTYDPGITLKCGHLLLVAPSYEYCKVNQSLLKFLRILKMKSSFFLRTPILILLCLLWIPNIFCSAENDTITDDITVEELEALNFTCNWKNDCKNPRKEEDDNLYLHHCICDRHCVTYGACCLDSEFRPRLNTAPDPGVEINCINTYGANSRSVYMVDNCKISGTIKDLCNNNGEDWNDPFLLIPVTSKVTNITYKNYYCAVCNEQPEAEQLIFWTIIVDDKSKSSGESEVPELKFSHDLESWMTLVPNNGNFTRVTIGIETLERPEVKYCKRDLITECDRKWTDAAVAEKCRAYMSMFSIYDFEKFILSRYKNPHCAICNFEVLSIRKNSCFVHPGHHDHYEGGRRFVIDDKDKMCERGAVYDIFSKKCRCNSELNVFEGSGGHKTCVLKLGKV